MLDAYVYNCYIFFLGWMFDNYVVSLLLLIAVFVLKCILYDKIIYTPAYNLLLHVIPSPILLLSVWKCP